MNNETEQIFILNPSGSQVSAASQKIEETPVTSQGVEDFSTVCRTCATVTEFVIPIFDGEGLQNNLAEKIHKHLPIQVCETDVLPRVVCYQCASTLLAWHELVQCCVQADAALRTRLAVAARPQPAAAATVTSAEAEPNSKEDNQNSDHEQQKCENYIYAKLKSTLTDYFPAISEQDGDIDVEFVCQKCEPRTAANSIQNLAAHLITTHSDVCNSSDIKIFVENYVTLEETLASYDSDRDIEHEPVIEPAEPIPNFYCPFCESIFSSPSRLVCHLNQHVNISLEHGVVCCDTTFNTKKMFVNHLQEHHINRVVEDTSNNCRTCGHEADSPTDLQDHISQTHIPKADSLEKNRKEPSSKNQKFIPAVCPECNKVFSNKYNMFAHMKSHSEILTKYACDVCNKTYSNPGNLKSHRKVAHEGVLQFACVECGEAFPTRGARSVHARLHSGQRPYACPHCPKAFRAKNTLDRHMDMHLDIRKHACHVCPKKFRKRTHLTYHLRTHKGDP